MEDELLLDVDSEDEELVVVVVEVVVVVDEELFVVVVLLEDLVVVVVEELEEVVVELVEEFVELAVLEALDPEELFSPEGRLFTSSLGIYEDELNCFWASDGFPNEMFTRFSKTFVPLLFSSSDGIKKSDVPTPCASSSGSS